ncbi:hypothetical protein [Streptomyces klenkii]|uniref:lytic transglycosylase domain-containing protein n=1 Tax=Streptomyces klenkii TaxID=1420899 RepID=UPI001319CE93|nr:hypothetical protein [Streptomyces klenkii]
MNTPRTQALLLLSRRGLGAALLAACLTTATVAMGTSSGAPNSPGPNSLQSRPHGSPNLALPDLAAGPDTDRSATPTALTDRSTGIPATALAAYRHAETLARALYPHCHLPWQLIAGIGKVESQHASGYGLRPDGSTTKPIIGPALDGTRYALVKDTDHGTWDRDPTYDHAVGPLQFIPTTWRSYPADGRGGGIKDPTNIFDAAAGTARYLCAGNKDLSKPADLDRAILSYNNSRPYANAVKAWMRAYRTRKPFSLPDPGIESGSTFTPLSPAPGTSQRPLMRGDTPQPERRPGTTDDPTSPVPSPHPTPGKSGTDWPDPSTPPERPDPTEHVERIDNNHDLTIVPGTTAATGLAVKVLDQYGRPVPGARVHFRIIGTNNARFHGNDTSATTTTGSDGTAPAPRITTTDTTRQFTIRTTTDNTTTELTTTVHTTTNTTPPPLIPRPPITPRPAIPTPPNLRTTPPRTGTSTTPPRATQTIPSQRPAPREEPTPTPEQPETQPTTEEELS